MSARRSGPVDPRILPHLRPARRQVGLVLVGNTLAGLLVVAQAFAVAALLTRLIDDPSSTSWHGPAVVLVLLLVARAAVSAVVDLAAASAAARVGRELRRTVLRRALDLESTRYAEHRVGELSLLATRGVAAVEPYLTRYVPALVIAAVLPVLTVVAIVTQDWISGLIVVLTVPLVPVFAILIGLTTQEKSDRQWRILTQLSGHFVDVVRGLPTLVAHRRATSQSSRIREVTDRYRRANRDVLRLAFASSAALELIATLSVALVAVVIGLRLAGGGVGLETALVVLLLAPEAYWPLRRVGAEYHSAAEGTATFDAIHRLTAEPLPVVGTAPVPDSTVMTLDDLTLTWPGRESPAIDGLSTTIADRTLTVITGPSGCGKSTLLTALLGELTPSSGTVRVGGPDGVDLASLDPDAWRSSVSYLPQRPWLMEATLGDNIRLGRPDATDADVRAALHRVDLDLAPDLMLGEDGAGLSAGQRARVALARVLVADRPIVLLDEPTAHLDDATEQVLLQVVQDLARTRTVVAVAHRDALVAAADVVLALPAPAVRRGSGGRVVHLRPRSSTRTATTEPPPVDPQRPGGRLLGATLLSVLAATCGVALTATAGWLIARSAEHPPVLMLMAAIVGVRTFGLGRPVFRYAERLVSHDVALRLLAERRAQVYDALVPLVPGRLGRRRGDLLTSVVDDVDALLDDQLRVRMPVWTWLGTTLLTGVVLALFLPAAALAAVLGALLAGALAWGTARFGAARHGAEQVAARADLSRLTVGLLTDARSLQHWQADDVALAGVDRAGHALGAARTGAARWLAVARCWPLVAAAAGMVGAAVLSGSAMLDGSLSGPVAALLLLVPLAMVDVISPVAEAGALKEHTRAATARLDHLTTLRPAVTDPEQSRARHGDAVELRTVSAGWDDQVAVRDVSLDLSPGRAVGVVGPSGCGKSTLAAVLVRNLAPRSGEHLLGGVDVTQQRADDVRAAVGLLDDDPYLFASTLVENVRLARPDATDAEVEQALRHAWLGSWLDALPEGLDTLLGDGAASVSGGERARIGLARLLLADHPVLVLDEPTAHLDTDTARLVARDLLSLRGERSILWITHTAVGLDAMDEVLTLPAAAGRPGSGPVGVRRDGERRHLDGARA